MRKTLSLAVLAALLVPGAARADAKADAKTHCVDIGKYKAMDAFEELWRQPQAEAEALSARTLACLKALTAVGDGVELELEGFKSPGKPWIGKVADARELVVRVGGWAWDAKTGARLHLASVALDALRDPKYAEQMKEVADACIAAVAEVKKSPELSELRFSASPEDSLKAPRSMQTVFCDDLRSKAVKYLNDRSDKVKPERLELIPKVRPGSLTEESVRKVAAAPGVEVVEPMKPDWCPDGRFDPAGEREAKDYNRRVQKPTDLDELRLREVALYACANPDSPAWQQQVAAWRQEWLNLTRLPEAVDRAALKLRADAKGWDRLQDETCATVKAMPSATAEQAALRKGLEFLFACSRYDATGYFPTVYTSSTPPLEVGWYVDRTPELASHLLAAIHVRACHIAGRERGDAGHVACIVTQREDVAALDAEKALAEAAALKLGNEFAKVRVREAVAAAKAEHQFYDELFASALKAKEPALVKPLFETADKAYAAFKAHWAANKALHERRLELLAKALDPAGDAKGCTKEAFSLLQQVVKKDRLDTRERLEAMGSDPVVSPFVYTLVFCAAAEKAGAVEYPYRSLYFRAPMEFRGPRAAAFWAAFTAFQELEKGRKLLIESRYLKTPIAPPEKEQLAGWGSGSVVTSAGQVTKVAKGPGPGQVTVSFKTTSYKMPVFNCRDTKQIERFLPDGRIAYRQECTSAGEATHKVVTDPIAIPAETAKPVVPGITLVVESVADGKGSLTGTVPEGFPVKAFADAAQKKMLLFLGLPVSK